MAAEEKKRGFFSNLMDRFKGKQVQEPPEEQPVAVEDQGEKESKVSEPEPELQQPVQQVEDEKSILRGISNNADVKDKDKVSREEPEKASFFDRLKPSGWFKRLTEGLEKTRKSFIFKMKGLFRLRNVIDEDFWDELEEILISADVGLETTQYIVEEMKKAVDEQYISEPSHLLQVMKEKLQQVMEEQSTRLRLQNQGLTVIMVVGVNGTGKTTSIAKLAARLMQENKKVIIAAADTFRAAAIEQLEVWARKLGLEVIKHQEGSDPAAVVFDAVNAALARKADVLIVDTAGRLHSKINLMKELEKINRVIKRNIPDAPHETLLVLDATTGQNALIQAKTFRESVDVTGIILTKLDGTAKGGVIIGIVHEQKIPVKFIGIGEGVYDLRPFESKSFLDALFSESDESQTEEPAAV